jgi:hypothetical protein
MTDSPKDINEQLEELKRAYVKGFGAKIEEVGAAAGAVRTDPLLGPGFEALGALKQLVHKLVRSGETFGFWEISNAAERAKTACEALLELPSMDRWQPIEGGLEELRNAVNGALDGG